jgi:hypothetical protein
VEKITDSEVVFRNYEGQRFRYPLTNTPLPAVREGERDLVAGAAIVD